MAEHLESEKIFDLGRHQGLAPEYLLLKTGTPLLEEEERRIAADEEYESIWLRLKKIAFGVAMSQGVSTHGHMARLLGDCLDRNLSKDSLLFLHSQGWSLRWLFFGTGTPSAHEAILPAVLKTDAKRFTAIQELKTLLGLGSGDITWLLGREYTNPDKDTPLSSSVSILIRLLEHIPPIQFFPEMPDVALFIERIKNVIHKISIDDVPEEHPQVRESLKLLKKSSILFCMLFFVTRNTISTWKNGRNRPKTQHLRLMYILSVMLDKYGDKAFVAYLRLLDAEAQGSGYASFSEVLSLGEWKKK